MADRRITSVVRTSSGVAVSSPCLLWGVLLCGKTGAASATICDYATSTDVPASSRVLPIYQASATASDHVLLPVPRQMSSGIYISMGGAAAHCVIYYTTRR